MIAEWAASIGVPVVGVATAYGALRLWVRGELGAAVGALLLGAVGMTALANLGTLERWAFGTPGGPAPESHGDGPSVMPWILLGLPATLTVGLAALGLVRLGGRLRQKRRSTREEAAAAQARRHAIEADHDEVTDAYGAYLCDVLAVLDRPALDDVTVPQTAALLHALDAAADARRGTDLDAYRKAVSALKTAWRTADEHARKTGTRHLSAPERSTITKARRLFEKALDERGSEHERQAAHARARALLDGVLTLPRQAVAAVEHQTRPALAKGA